MQYTLLTEILKKAGIPSSYLVRMIKECGITPSWEHIPLPQGIIVQLPAKAERVKKKALQININMALTPAPVKAVHSARAKRPISIWFSSLCTLQHILWFHFHRDPI